MKKLRIPENNSEYIDISNVNSNFQGIIIVYSNSKPIGIIMWNECYFEFYTTIDANYCEIYEETLINLVKQINLNFDSVDYKVIEFNGNN